MNEDEEKEKKRLYNVQYRKDNLDRIKKKKKEYYNKNKEKISKERKEYRKENKEKIKKTKNKYYKDNKLKITEQNKKYYKDNKEIIIKQNKKYYRDNKEIILDNVHKYYIDNKENIKQKKKEYYHNKIKNDPILRLKRNIRTSIGNSLRRNNYSKTSNTRKILGCTFNEFKLHLESQFEPWMSWENYGLYNNKINHGWDIDHIIPLCSENTEEGIIKLNHYSNLQPLCSKVNRDIKKGNY